MRNPMVFHDQYHPLNWMTPTISILYHLGYQNSKKEQGEKTSITVFYHSLDNCKMISLLVLLVQSLVLACQNLTNSSSIINEV